MNKKLLILAVFGTISVMLAGMNSTTLYGTQYLDTKPGYSFIIGPWWDTSWSYRKLISINHSQVDSDLTNFPILIDITDTDLRDDAQDDGDDIAFVMCYDVINQLNHEIEQYDNTTGHLVAWVNVTNVLSTRNTSVYMYYGNSGCSSQENVSATWDSDYLGVWHMNQTNPLDSTSNDFDGTSEGSQTTSTGKVGTGLNFDGTDDEVNLGAVANCTTAVTVSSWIKISTSENTYGAILEKDSFAANVGHYGLYSTADWINSKSCFQINDLPDAVDDETEGSDLRYNDWCYLVGTWDDATDHIILYENASSVSDLSSATGPITGTSGNVVLGNRDGQTRWLYGIIDEVRISNVARNAAWITTSYNTMNNTSTFISVGDEKTQ